MFSKYKYDIAISVAAEELPVAERIAAALKTLKITYYLYTEQTAAAAGELLIKTSWEVYGRQSRYILLLTSKVFKKKYWTGIEQMIGKYAALRKKGFLLQLPLDGALVDRHLGSIPWHDDAHEVAAVIRQKLLPEKRKRRIALWMIASLFTLGLLYKFVALPAQKEPLGQLFTTAHNKNEAQSDTGTKLPADTQRKTVPVKDSGKPQQPGKEEKPATPKSNGLLIKAGSFTMGATTGNPDEAPPHTVTLNAFYMSPTEITVAQYRVYCDSTGKTMPPQPYTRTAGEYPLVYITWHEAKAYCSWAGGRLPTEAEWEYAATAGQTYTYSGGDNAALVAVYATNSGGNANKVKGQRQPNAFGLYDMSGNVAEWCNDFYDSSYYARCTGSKYQGPKSGTCRVVRGGAFNSTIKPDNQLRVTRRGCEAPGNRSDAVGFRVVWDLK